MPIHIRWRDTVKEMARHSESPRMYRAAQGPGLSLVEMDKGICGSENFGVLLMHTKGAMFYVGNGATSPVLHAQEDDFTDDMPANVVTMLKWLVVH